MMKLSQMNVKELRDYLEFLGADKKRLYGTSKEVLRLMAYELERTDGETWYVVMNGEVIYKGYEMRCGYTISKDETGEMEMGPAKEFMGWDYDCSGSETKNRVTD